MNIAVIIWDVDGTFYKSSKELWDKFQYELMSRVSEILGLSFEEYLGKHQQKYKELGSHTQTIDSFGVDAKKTIDEVVQQKLPELLERDEQLIKMFDGLKDFRHVILTNAGLEITEKKLKKLGLSLDRFEKVFTTYDMKYVKPDPRVYIDILNDVGVGAEKCLVVGDRVETDLTPARALGMKTCLVWGNGDKVDFCLDEVYQVEALMRR